MKEEEQDAMIRRLAEEALRPPPVPTEELWARIQAARALGQTPTTKAVLRPQWSRRTGYLVPLGMAALVALAFGLGHWSAAHQQPAMPGALAVVNGNSAAHHIVAGEYLGSAEVFLTSFRAAARSGSPDSTAPVEARRLLSTARLLLDSRASEDVRVRGLLEDLELVLAEISQLSADPNGDVKLITDGLDQRGTLGRLRFAVPAGGVPVTTQGVL